MTEVIQSLDQRGIDDNARKFTSGAIAPSFLTSNNATSYTLVTDWIVTGDDSEEKVVAKTLDTGEVQYLSIKKVIRNGSRTTDKAAISKDEYSSLRARSVAHSEKRRSDFNFVQNGISYALKYDEFPNGDYMLEVDASGDDDRKKFDPLSFPVSLVEVTGNLRYYGYRIAETIAAPKKQ